MDFSGQSRYIYNFLGKNLLSDSMNCFAPKTDPEVRLAARVDCRLPSDPSAQQPVATHLEHPREPRSAWTRLAVVLSEVLDFHLNSKMSK